MKKTFPLESPDHQAPRVVASVKNDVRKYIKRERKKKLPDDVDFWDFDCRVGLGEEAPVTKHVEEVIPAIDEAAAKQCSSVYIEILAKPGVRKSKPGSGSKPPAPSDS